MTKSRAVGPFRARPQITNGIETGKWFVDVPASLTSNGKRKRKLFDNQKRALEVARELSKSIDPVTGMLRVRQRPSGIAIEEAVKEWLASEQLRVKTLKKRETTLYIDACRLKSATAFFKGEALSAITEERLVEFQAPVSVWVENPRPLTARLPRSAWCFDGLSSRAILEAFPRSNLCRSVPSPW